MAARSERLVTQAPSGAAVTKSLCMMDVYQILMQNCWHETSRLCPFLKPTAPFSFPLNLFLGKPCVRAASKAASATGEEKGIHCDAGSSRVSERKEATSSINKQASALQLRLVANYWSSAFPR